MLGPIKWDIRGWAKSENNAIFSNLLKPSKYILDIINANKPKSYGTIHFRLENDLKTAKGFWEKKVNIKKIYDKIKNDIKEIPEFVYACVCKQDVTDKNDLKILNNKISPWENVPLVFGGSDICKKYNINEKHHHLIGAIIDYYTAIDSTHFFYGHGGSTFSAGINIIRKKRKNEAT